MACNAQKDVFMKNQFTKKKTIRILAVTIPAMILGVLLILYGLSQSGFLGDRLIPADSELTQHTDSIEAMQGSEEVPDLPEISSEPEPEPEPYIPVEYDIHLMAVGDNLMHMGVVNAGKQEDGTYNYDFLYEGLAPFLEKADIRIVNQETILGGNASGFSGYPHFNSPTQVGDALVKAGFNVILHASNHAADMSIEGLLNCVDYWETQPEVLMVGINKEGTADDEEREIPLFTVEDVTFAILNYTYGPNMEVIPSNIRGYLNILCDWDRSSGLLNFTKLNPQVIEDIERADELADVVIVCPHWGTEYMTTPSGYQQDWAMQMTLAGADLIIGTHPHVVQPVEFLTAENGNTSLCYYSLGNYVSTQKQPICMFEAMAWVTFHYHEEEGVSLRLEDSGALPLVCHYTSGPVRAKAVYPLEDYTTELADAHGILNYGGKALHLEDLQQWNLEILGDYAMKAEELLEDSDD